MTYIPNPSRYQDMIYRNCGTSGLKLPLVSFGLWHNFGTNANYDNMEAMCCAAFDMGITHFDLANNYGPPPGSAEESFGAILKRTLMPHRDEFVISTKAGYTMWDGPYGDFGSRKYLLASLDQSLGRMGLDYVDIFYHHRMDADTPLEETMGALHQAVVSGKALYVGLSNYDGATLTRATQILDELKCPFIINQNKYSMLERTIERNGLKEACRTLGKGLIVFSPLAQGLLSDRYLKGVPQDSRMVTDGRFLQESALTSEQMTQLMALNEIAKSRGQSLAQMALSYLAQDEVITSVLVGASKVSQLRENVAMMTNLKFTDDEKATIEALI